MLKNVHVTIRSPSALQRSSCKDPRRSLWTFRPQLRSFRWYLNVPWLNTDAALMWYTLRPVFQKQQTAACGCQMSTGTSCRSLRLGRLSCYSSCVFSDLTFLQDRPTLLSSPVLIWGQDKLSGEPHSYLNKSCLLWAFADMKQYRETEQKGQVLMNLLREKTKTLAQKSRLVLI